MKRVFRRLKMKKRYLVLDARKFDQTIGRTASVWVGEWLKRVGEPFVQDEPLINVEFDKAVITIPAPESGILTAILIRPGSSFVGKRRLAEYDPVVLSQSNPNREKRAFNIIETPPAFEALWAAYCPAIKTALRNTQTDIESWLQDHAVPRRLRVVSVESRPKTRLSVLRRITLRGRRDPEKAFRELKDLVGARVVVANLQDAERVAELLNDELRRLKLDPTERRDTDPHTGYRAIHIWFNRPEVHAMQHFSIPCEIQIRTLAQDMWARLSHSDFYKGDSNGIPNNAAARMRRLAEILSLVDEEAAAIRLFADEGALNTVLPYDSSDPVEFESLASYLYDKHSVSLKAYWLDLHLANFQRCGIKTIGEIELLLGNGDLRMKLQDIAARIFNRNQELGLLEQLFFGAITSRQGLSAAESALKTYVGLSAGWRGGSVFPKTA